MFRPLLVLLLWINWYRTVSLQRLLYTFKSTNDQTIPVKWHLGMQLCWRKVPVSLSLGCSCWSRQSLGGRRSCRAAWPCAAPTSAYSREDVHEAGLNKPINKPVSPRSGHFSIYCLNCLAWVLYCLRPGFGVGWECWDIHNPTVWASVSILVVRTLPCWEQWPTGCKEPGSASAQPKSLWIS